MVKKNIKTTKKKRPTLPLFEEYLLSLQVNNYSPETVYNYERDLKTFINFLDDENLEFKKLIKLHIDRYKAYLYSIDRSTSNKENQKKRLSAYSVNRFLSSLRSYLRYLIENDEKVPVLPEHIKLVKSIKNTLKYPNLIN